MSTKDQKTAPELAFRDGQGKTQSSADYIPTSNFSTLENDIQPSGRISSVLGVGASNAIPAMQLAELFGSDVRMVREAVQRERLAGVPICAEGNGYFLPGDVSELVRFSRCIAHRARETQRVADAVRRSLDELTGQERIEEVLTDE